MANSLEVGAIVEGKVFQIKPFGAFVSLPDNKKGLVHISHISHGYIKDVSDVLHEGDTVKVKILSMDPGGKISLSIREATPKPAPEPREFNKRENEKSSSNLEDLLKEWTKQSNDRHTDINRRLKR
ncbi:MAG: S1 RNA-binding domain-containing protein [Peptostreptococcaceae bacterium]|nr:S1 RNA-binding domain-containing protein [Peptostreptococcaceae bacterium]